MVVDLHGLSAKFRLEPDLIDRLHRRLRLPFGCEREAHQRLELLCLAAITRHLHHTMPTWIRWERTPIDDAIDEAAKRHPQWTRFDWDCDGEMTELNWSAAPGERVRIFTRGREFIGYGRAVSVEQPDPADVPRKPSVVRYHFEAPIPEWARIPGTNRPNIGRVLPA